MRWAERKNVQDTTLDVRCGGITRGQWALVAECPRRDGDAMTKIANNMEMVITGVIEKRREEVVGEMCARSKYMKTHKTYQECGNEVEWGRRQGGVHVLSSSHNRRWIYVEEVSPMASGRMLLLKCTMFVDPIVEQEVMM